MKHSIVIVAMTAMAGSIIGSAVCSRAQAAVPVVFDGTAGVDISSDPDSNGKYRWEGANWTKNGIPGQSAVATMGDNNGGQGGLDITIGGGRQVYYDINRPCPSTDACVIGALGDFKPRMDVTPGGSLTVKEGSLLSMVSKTDNDGRWNRIGLSITLDNGTWRNSYTSPSNSSKIIFGYHNELLPNQHIDIKVINGGRLENHGKMIFGELDYFPPDGSNNGHSDGIEVAMTINNGTLDLTGGGFPDYPFGLISGELIFGYEYHQNVGPRNEKYSINFTGPGSITVDPHYDDTAGQYLGGIYVVKQDSSGAYTALGGGDFFTPIGYDNLWDLGILQANGQSGLTGATFSNYFTTTGDKFHENYTLTSLLAASLPGDYNGDHKVDAADYVLWRKNPTTYGGNPAGYNTWRANFGNTGAGSGSLGSGTVPEPATFMLVALGLAGFWMVPQRFDR